MKSTLAFMMTFVVSSIFLTGPVHAVENPLSQLGEIMELPVDVSQLYRINTLALDDGGYGRFPYRILALKRPKEDHRSDEAILGEIIRVFHLKDFASMDDDYFGEGGQGSSNHTYHNCLRVKDSDDLKFGLTSVVTQEEIDQYQSIVSRVNLDEVKRILSMPEEEYYEGDYIKKYEILKDFYIVSTAKLVQFLQKLERPEKMGTMMAYPLPPDFRADDSTPEELATQEVYADRFGYFVAKIFINKEHIIIMVIHQGNS